MGNKAMKQYIQKRKEQASGRSSRESGNSSDLDLAEFLAVFSSQTSDTSNDLIYCNQSPAHVKPRSHSLNSPTQLAKPSVRSLSLKEKRKRLKRSKAVCDDLSIVNQSKGIPYQSETCNWAEIKERLIWCMESNTSFTFSADSSSQKWLTHDSLDNNF